MEPTLKQACRTPKRHFETPRTRSESDIDNLLMTVTESVIAHQVIGCANRIDAVSGPLNLRWAARAWRLPRSVTPRRHPRVLNARPKIGQGNAVRSTKICRLASATASFAKGKCFSRIGAPS